MLDSDAEYVMKLLPRLTPEQLTILRRLCSAWESAFQEVTRTGYAPSLDDPNFCQVAQSLVDVTQKGGDKIGLIMACKNLVGYPMPILADETRSNALWYHFLWVALTLTAGNEAAAERIAAATQVAFPEANINAEWLLSRAKIYTKLNLPFSTKI